MTVPLETDSIGSEGEIFERLKSATAKVHAEVEEFVPVFDPGFDLLCYIQLLKSFHGFWAPVEAKLLLMESLLWPALALPTRMKTHLLQADLRIFGEETGTLPRCVALPLVPTFAASLGCLYVLEGSTLGARLISRRLETHLRLRQDSGAAFFNAYGEAVGQRWTEFRLFVKSHLLAEQCGEMVEAAVETFESLLAWLRVQSDRRIQ